jgi:3-phosphoshikimate 1-carboxyvinyltransferase
MEVTIGSSGVAGTVRAPPSKSYSHRAILAGGFSGDTKVKDALISADTRATMRAVEAFGGAVTIDDGTVLIDGFAGTPRVPDDVVDCANSGTTMRLITAAAGLVDGWTVLTGDDSLRARPHGPLLDAITALGGRGISTRNNGQAPLVVGGPIGGGDVSIPGDVSSQFVTALLMSGAATQEGITINLETELKSAPYVKITQEVLGEFGVETEETRSGYRVAGNQSYDAENSTYSVPGDFSSISYLVAAGVLAGDDELVVRRARPSAQGDEAILDIIRDMGGAVSWDQSRGEITVTNSSLSGTTVGVANTPDLLPTIAVLGAAASDVTRITDVEHVRYKETDRVAVMARELQKLGATVTEHENDLVLHAEG